MSEEELVEEPKGEDVEALKARIAELEAENQQLKERVAELEAENERLRQALGEAGDTLKAYVEKEKAIAIKQILEKANWNREELERLDLPQLKLIQKSIDSVKGTVKNIRSAGAGSSKRDSGLTVGDLYHKE